MKVGITATMLAALAFKLYLLADQIDQPGTRPNVIQKPLVEPARHRAPQINTHCVCLC